MNIRKWSIYTLHIRNCTVLFLIILLVVSISIFHVQNVKSPNIQAGSYTYFDLPPLESHIDFAGIEASLSQIMPNTSNQLILNSSAESSLSKAEIHLDSANIQTSLERAQFLIQESFIGSLGQELSRILFKYRDYKIQERLLDAQLALNKNTAENPRSVIQNERKALEERNSLQIEYLGEKLAKDLYGSQNQLASILIDLRSIELNTELSAEEKKRKNEHLHNKLNLIMQNNDPQ